MGVVTARPVFELAWSCEGTGRAALQRRVRRGYMNRLSIAVIENDRNAQAL